MLSVIYPNNRNLRSTCVSTTNREQRNICRAFQLPDTATFHDYIEYVKTFPLNDDPSMFGMHPNADISFAQAETYACLNTLLALQPRQVGTAAASVEEVTNRLAQDMLSTIPRTFDLAAMQQKYFIEILLCLYAANEQESRFASPSSSFYFLRSPFPYISNVHVQRDACWLYASLPKPSILVFRLFVSCRTNTR